jgi:glycosyltransferase involved in cell wall biosynthesis
METPQRVSVLMVTSATQDREPLIDESLRCLRDQTFREIELVIVIDPKDRSADEREAALDAMRQLAEKHGFGDAKVHVAPCGTTLGGLRNLSVAEATCDVVCQWDDDDLYHRDRIQKQLEALCSGDFAASYLQDNLQWFTGTGEVYWTSWMRNPSRCHQGTLVARRNALPRYPEEGPEARSGEDAHVQAQLAARGGIAHVRREPWLYVYRCHGSNTTTDAHRRMVAQQLGVSRATLERYGSTLMAALAELGLPQDARLTAVDPMTKR